MCGRVWLKNEKVWTQLCCFGVVWVWHCVCVCVCLCLIMCLLRKKKKKKKEGKWIFFFIFYFFLIWRNYFNNLEANVDADVSFLNAKYFFFKYCKVVIFKYVFCWLLFRTKFDCNFIQSYVPCICCENLL